MYFFGGLAKRLNELEALCHLLNLLLKLLQLLKVEVLYQITCLSMKYIFILSLRKRKIASVLLLKLLI